MKKISIIFAALFVAVNSFAAVNYELNGGVTNDDNWLGKADMWAAFCADAGISVGTLDEVKANKDPFTLICGKLLDANVTTIMGIEKWDWLEAYMMEIQNADANAVTLVEDSASAGWRYALAAFFVEGHRTSWPKSADFSMAGKVEAFMPAWQHGFANPTEPTAEFVLNAPYLEGKTFDGWYATADFSGEKVLTVNAETTGTLYAKWIDYVSTVAEVRALADDTEATTAGVVNFVSGKNIWIQDATGGILVYASETPACEVGQKITVKGKKVMYGGAPELSGAAITSTEAGELFAVTAFEGLGALVADSLEHKYFAARVTVPGVTIVEYDSYNNPIVADAAGNQAKCYKMVLDPTVYPVGTKVTVTAVAGWYNGFQFVGNAADIVRPVVGKKENFTYPARHNGKYNLENNWVISNMEGNYAANKPGSHDMVRGMVAKDGIMYFINRETQSITRVDAATGEMLDPLVLQGTDTLFNTLQEDGTWKVGCTYGYNDIKFDQAGNCLIGGMLITGTTTCQTFYIYTVDLETGVCTKLIEDVLWETPGLDGVQFRFDAFGCAGDVTKNGVVMAADANSWNVYRWLITDGVAGKGEQIELSYESNYETLGTAPQIFPQDENGELFYVDGFNTFPMLFYINSDKIAYAIDDFNNVPTYNLVWNNKDEEIYMNMGVNGLAEFKVGNDYFLLMGATTTSGNPSSSFALYKFANEDRSFDGLEPLWYFPTKGMGTTTNGFRLAMPSVEVVDDHTAKLHVYFGNNGYASYTLTVQQDTVSEIPSKAITVKAKVPVEWTDTIMAWVWPTGGDGREVAPTREGDWYVVTENCDTLNIIYKNGSGWKGDIYQTVDMKFAENTCVEVLYNNEGKADYEVVDCESEVVPSFLTYELNGGVTNDDNWLGKADMWAAFCADAGISVGTLDEVKANKDPFTLICGKLLDANVTTIMGIEKWDWLEAYMMEIQNADANAVTLVEDSASAGWRYALAAFFVEGHRTSWPKSADFSMAGKVEAFMPAWQHGFANPTEPTAEFVLNAPYLEGKTFDGWYATADFSGEKVLTVNAETTGTLYAKWIDYVSTVAEVRALADDTEATTAGVVNFVSGKNIWIQDATGGILVYASETPACEVGQKITVKGKKVMYGGAPELSGAAITSTEAGELFAVTAFEGLGALVADSLEHKYFAARVTVPGVTIVEYDSYNNPIVADAAGNQAKCYKMVLDPTVYPVGTKVTVTAVAGWYNGFQFVGNAADIVRPVVGKKENFTYPARHNGKYALENNWVISNTEDNFAANKPGANDFVRGMAAKDGIMYFINRETQSIVRVDGKTGDMLDPIVLQGTDTLFKSQTINAEGETVWADGTTLPYNDIKFDQAGNCLIGACMTGATTCQTFFIYVVDLETGVCTKLIEDVLWENPGLDQVQFRFDAFGAAGDVTKNGVVMAADANGSWNVYRWLITDGVAGEGEQVAVLLDPAVDQSLYINAAGYGTAPQIFPQDEEGSLFYVDGFNTLPMLFYGNPEEGAVLIDDFINAPYGTKVWNNAGHPIAMNANFNGLVEFQVGEEYFLLMAATGTAVTPPSCFALYKFADEDRAFTGLEPLWYFPHNGLGTATNGCRTAVPSVEVVSNTEAVLYLYAANNGYASYTLTIHGEDSDVTTGMDSVSDSSLECLKVLRDGQLIILRDGVEYNAQGAKL